jgi:glutamate racemase
VANKKSPIGIFDSGIGGLTVVKAVMEALPGEDIVYFGDTARVPYGIKSMETVREYGLQITNFLMRKKVKMILIACNTVSAAAEPQIVERAAPIPVLGVVKAGSKAACEVLQPTDKVGVIGTLATVNSGTYENAIQAINPGMQVFSKACPLLVPLAEEGWTDNEVALKTLEIYLTDIKANKLNGLILGCTHYPLFRDPIRTVLGNPDIKIIDSAESIANSARAILAGKNLLNPQEKGTFDCYVSDKPQRFQQLAERFLGESIPRIELVSLDQIS